MFSNKDRRWKGRSDVYICPKCKQQHHVKKKQKKLKFCIMCGGLVVRETDYAAKQGSSNVRQVNLGGIASGIEGKGRPVDNSRERRGLTNE